MTVPEKLTQDPESAHFIYDEVELRRSLQVFQGLLSQGFIKDLYFSVKSNPNASLLEFLSQFVSGFDISSFNELILLKRLGIDLSVCTFSGPAKTDQVLNAIFENRVKTLHVDSLDEWRVISKLEHKYGWRINKTIRIKHFSPIAAKLGFSEKEVHSLVSEQQAPQVEGLHFYLGRESFNVESLSEFIDWIEGFVRRWSSLFSVQPKIFVGLGIPMRDLVPLEKIVAEKSDFFRKYHVSFECGRSLVQSCGSYWTQVLSIKKRQPRDLIILNGGLQHLATKFESPNFGLKGIQIQGAEQIAENDLSSIEFDLSGSLGVWHDFLATEVRLPANIRRGDWIQVTGVGAYGWTSATNQFVGPSPVKEWWLTEDAQLKLISPSNMKTYLEVQCEL